MSFIMVDVEADGPIPSDYSMIALGAIIVEPTLSKIFYAKIKPISDKWKSDALAISGFSREETLKFEDPKLVLERFEKWIETNSKGRPIFISDNNGFDWMFVCWYFQHFLQRNPLGYSSQNLGSLYKGLMKDFKLNFKHLRKTAHTHNPVDDTKGNAEALLILKEKYNLNIILE